MGTLNKSCPHRLIVKGAEGEGSPLSENIPEFFVECDLIEGLDGARGVLIDEISSTIEEEKVFSVCSACDVPLLLQEKDYIPYEVELVEGVVLSTWINDKGLLVDPYSGKLHKDIEVENMMFEDAVFMNGGEVK